MTDYTAAGVDYDTLDATKRSALATASSIPSLLSLRGAQAIDNSRGEPAFVLRLGDTYLATVLECLGTKSTIARHYQDLTGINRFDAIGYDTVAAIVNDIACVGALPIAVNAYFATGSPKWYQVEGRLEALTMGWARACEDAGSSWGGGESPGLSGIISEDEIDLAGSAVGVIPDGVEPILGEDLAPADQIVLVTSTGMHTNGASMVRKLASDLPDGLATRLPSGESFGESTLLASEIYVSLVDALLRQRLPVTYLSHVTGHGLRKLMRANKNLTYRITDLPPVPEVLSFMVDQLDMSADSAYGTFNMGSGFAVYCRPGSGEDVVAVARSLGFDARVAGTVEAGERQVILEPVGVSYSGDQLQLR